MQPIFHHRIEENHHFIILLFFLKDKIDKKIIGPKKKTQIKTHISNEMRIKS